MVSLRKAVSLRGQRGRAGKSGSTRFRHKAATGSIQAQRLLFKLLEQAQERATESEQNTPKPRGPNATAKEYTEEELEWMIENSPEYQFMKEYRRLNGGELPKLPKDLSVKPKPNGSQ